jgi:hypothetical protein
MKTYESQPFFIGSFEHKVSDARNIIRLSITDNWKEEIGFFYIRTEVESWREYFSSYQNHRIIFEIGKGPETPREMYYDIGCFRTYMYKYGIPISQDITKDTPFRVWINSSPKNEEGEIIWNEDWWTPGD